MASCAWCRTCAEASCSYQHQPSISGPRRQKQSPRCSARRQAAECDEAASCRADPCRRQLLQSTAAVLTAIAAGQRPPPAEALDTAAGLKNWRDRIDGYQFTFPRTWFPVTTSGNDIFFRNPSDVDENLFVSISSPSTSQFTSIEDLGGPEEAAERTLRQYLEELKTTRLGVKRSGDIVSASSRTASDGRVYYDLQHRLMSYASRDQLDVTGRAPQFLEWDRNYVTVLGVANKRLYEFRLQSSHKAFEAAKDRLVDIAESFSCKEVV